MYLRFVSSHWDDQARAESGLFCAFSVAREARDDGRLTGWQIDELGRMYHWFCLHLDKPGSFVRRCGKGERAGVCWFRPEAAEHVSNARYMAWLLCDIGFPVEELRARRPGTILWSDNHQVVAIPYRNGPRAFH
ncbi:MAG: hypothetical protein AAFQ66_18330 [Pseudomonadota bacterium]